jgi:hypothetical protein
MKTKTGLLALGFFTIAGALTMSCGGSDSSDGNPTAGSSGKGSGGNSSAGKPSSAGTTNSGAGTASNNGGSTGNNGGTNDGGRNTQGGFGPGLGGAGADLPDCPATAVEGQPCTPMGGTISACQVDDSNYCICQGQDPTWICPDLGDIGGGGAAGGGVTCPANAKSGDACTGFGLCPTVATCGCLGGSVLCQP